MPLLTANRTATIVPPWTKLAARASPYHPSVTLFETQDIVTETMTQTDSPRRSKRIKLETTASATNTEETAYESHSESKSPRKRAAKASGTRSTQVTNSPRKPKPIQQSLKVPHPAPSQWKEAYDMIKQMRTQHVAPVDTMGCDQAQHKETDPKNQRFATLISLMLSSQTKDEVTDAAVSKLREAVGGSLNVDNIIKADEPTISEAIGKVGFWRRKTEYIKKSALRLRDNFDSDIPKTVDELCSLPGVGPKMAFLLLQVAWKLNVGIGVDTHVHRITNRLGWHKPPTKSPEETRLNLQSWLPTELHPEINHMLVGFGQVICLPVRPQCDMCNLSTTNLCPSAKVGSRPKRASTISTKSIRSQPEIEIEIETEVAH